jgi:hypothetical protein
MAVPSPWGEGQDEGGLNTNFPRHPQPKTDLKLNQKARKQESVSWIPAFLI